MFPEAIQSSRGVMCLRNGPTADGGNLRGTIAIAPMESLPTTTRVQSQTIIRTDVPRKPNSFRADERASILECYTLKCATLKLFAGKFSASLVETGKARAINGLMALLNTFSDR